MRQSTRPSGVYSSTVPRSFVDRCAFGPLHGFPRATLRHTSDLANRVAQQLPSSLLRTARHHSSTMERMSHRQLGVELLAAGRHVPGREVPRTQRLTACLSIPPDR